MRTSSVLPFAVCLCLAAGSSEADKPQPDAEADRASFNEIASGQWHEVFFDPCTDDWTKQWTLDGEVGTVENTELGMALRAGPKFGENAHHVVLWTKPEFQGDIKIEYEYTRLDAETRCVNITYVQATGEGEGPYAKDISEWAELRRVASMDQYFAHMNTYHISYAAFGNQTETGVDYIRTRRYMPGTDRLNNTDLEPDYFDTGLFAPGVPMKITIVKRHRKLGMRIEAPDKTLHCFWRNEDYPPIEGGRIGLRHMFIRKARYKNFRVYKADGDK